MSSPTTATVSPPEVAGERNGAASPAAGRALAALRIATGSIFLWGFLDKTFGWGYSTSSESSWLEGNSPAEGYLAHVTVGPMESTYHDWAGQSWVDMLFMAGMLGLGAALISGVALRVTAVAGTAMMLFLWLGEFPPATCPTARRAGPPTPSSTSTSSTRPR